MFFKPHGKQSCKLFNSSRFSQMRPRLVGCWRYRQTLAVSLITTIGICLFNGLMVNAQEDTNGNTSEGWESMQDITFPHLSPEPSANTSQKLPVATTTAPSSHWWQAIKLPFFKKKEPPVSEAAITQVGPRTYPQTPGGLLRLPIPLRLPDGGTLAPGMYLCQLDAPYGTPSLRLIYKNQTAAVLPLSETTVSSANQPGPVTDITPKGLALQITPRITPDGMVLEVFLTGGAQHYQTAPLSQR